jgi:hypothetical protein
MTIELKLKGAHDEMERLFDTQNVKYYKCIDEERGIWHIVLRHDENKFNRVRTIKGLEKKLKNNK